MMNYKNGDIDLCFFSTSLLTQYEAKEDTIAADRQLVRTDFATIPVVWLKTPLCPARRLRWPLGPRELPLQGHVQERLELNERHIASRLHSSLSESCSIAESSFQGGWNCYKWLRTSGITAGIPVAAPLHHMDERLMHPEERRKQWRRAMQAD
jgi:hypothetical protein